MDVVPENLYLLQNDETTGPFHRETIREMLELGSISRTDLAWAEGMDEWVTVESLFDLAPASPPRKRKRKRKKGAGAPSFASFVGQSLAYPFRGYGWVTILTGTFVLSLLDWFSALPAAPGILSLIIGVLAWGYLLLMLQSVIVQTAMGESDLPQWPEFDGYGELMEKVFQWLGVLVVCFGPALLGLIFLRPEAGMNSELSVLVLVGALLLGGAIYFPMSLLGVAVFDTIGAVNPILVFRSINAVLGNYVVVVLLFGCLLGCNAAIAFVTARIPVAGIPLYHFYSLWALMYFSRVLGGLYLVNKEKLNWF